MKKIITFLLILMILAACTKIEKNEYDYTFTGEGEYWEAEYSFSGTEQWQRENGKSQYSNKSNYEFEVIFKGPLESLSSIKTLEYSYETSSGSGDSKIEFEQQPPTKVSFKNRGFSENGAMINESEAIQVTVKWNDHEESFELQNIKK